MEMATAGYVNKTEILQYAYSWPKSGPTQQQLIFVHSNRYSWDSIMCIEEHSLTFEWIMSVL